MAATSIRRAGVGHGAGDTGDGDMAVFKGLAQDFENVSSEFGQLVEKEYSVVGEGDFSRTRIAAAAGKGGGGDGVVGTAEGALGHQSGVRAEEAGDAVDFCDIERFIEIKRREDSGQATREHRFTRSGAARQGEYYEIRRPRLPVRA